MDEPMCVEILCDAAAERALWDPAFLAGWSDLARACPWATVFQSPAFAATWYRAYRDAFAPVLAVSRDGQGRIEGILPLAIPIAECGRLCAAGDHQAEYQGWVCTAARAPDFPPAALMALRRRFPSAAVEFRYMAAGVPLDWMDAHPMRRTTLAQTFRRPLMRLGDGAEVEQSLRKPGNKSRLRQLKRLGPVDFVRVTDPAEFEPLLDEIARCHDCRQLAIHGCAPFAEDPLKRAFHVAMMREPDLLHATALKVGGRTISFQLNVTRGRELQLYLIAHRPRFAAYSPGKLHLLFLARMLVAEGYEQIDLTPGGDAYKDRFANASDEVRGLAVYPNIARRSMAAARLKIESGVRHQLGRFALTPADLRCAMSEWGHHVRSAPATLISAIRARYGGEPPDIYVRDASADGQMPVDPAIRCDDLNDLLRYRSLPGQPTRRRFVADALRRMEHGQHLYTACDGDALCAWAWLVYSKADTDSAANVCGFAIPPNSAAILIAKGVDSAAVMRLIGRMICDATAGRSDHLFVVVPQHLRLGDLLRAGGFRRGEDELNAAVPGRTAANEVPALTRREKRGPKTTPGTRSAPRAPSQSNAA